jgi:cell division initiation protein
MKVTPIEIRQKDFEKVFRGYEKEAVDAYLQSLSVEWERLQDENRNLSRKLDLAEKEIERLREVETSLFRTLKSAEETGNSMIEAANKKAELYVKEAQMNAETMLTEARYRAKSMIEDAEERSKDILGGLLHDVKDLEDKYFYISEMKDNLLRAIKSTLNDFSEHSSRYYNTLHEQKDFEAKLKAARSSINDKHYNGNNSTPIFDINIKKETNANPASEPTPKHKEENNNPSNSFFDNL